ncbi:STAS domain-containing protein [Tanticharoenia sakaeratensis]|uniref:MlaB-like STAS domain-containing protein n=1 Tax=Tanticharoenia sakaeratensis NBRC 103193 TaxID=1231623 RepID=A0A0D6MJG5_9PROT|nr:STAS domain-containing protein [Tanticharoenia sakaeratensis]GAN53789.1 hypothetical protein Tasa_011_008 [Tanticharoenia sakaeratensis NBRC 103193]GBQ22361.1 hypothetical protein AA103193_2043 [Tanticharoenia sakaeratensis NBRC 103193]
MLPASPRASSPPAGPGPVSLTLAPSLTSDEADPLLGALRETTDPVVRIDARRVERIGGLCLQILLSAARTFAASGRTLVFDSPSDAFVEGLTLLGARTLLLPEASA